MELCSIASGSSGNCICVGSDDCHVLIDAGISGKRIENGLNSIDLKTADMQGILITHELSPLIVYLHVAFATVSLDQNTAGPSLVSSGGSNE